MLAGLAFPGLEGELTGGIAVFSPDRPDLLARDAVCSAALMAAEGEKADRIDAAESFRAQARALMRQAAAAMPDHAERFEGSADAGRLDALCRQLKQASLQAD